MSEHSVSHLARPERLFSGTMDRPAALSRGSRRGLARASWYGPSHGPSTAASGWREHPAAVWGRRGVAAALIGATLLASSGCVPLVAAGAAVGGMAAIDRRTVGAQTEDQSIELGAQSRLSSTIVKGQSVSVTSFNRKVLLSGFVNDDEQKALAEKAVAGVQNVRSIHNELQVGFKPSIARSTNDAALTARVRAALIEARDLQSNIFKVVTESGIVYLMGVVTQREGDRGAQVASMVPGVSRVVTLFEYLSEGDLINLRTPNSKESPSGSR